MKKEVQDPPYGARSGARPSPNPSPGGRSSASLAIGSCSAAPSDTCDPTAIMSRSAYGRGHGLRPATTTGNLAWELMPEDYYLTAVWKLRRADRPGGGGRYLDGRTIRGSLLRPSHREIARDYRPLQEQTGTTIEESTSGDERLLPELDLPPVTRAEAPQTNKNDGRQLVGAGDIAGLVDRASMTSRFSGLCSGCS